MPENPLTPPSLTPPLQDLAGKNVLIMGGTSGIGRACAVLFASRGARVFVGGRTRVKLDSTLQAIRDADGLVEGLPVDVGSISGIKQFFGAARDFLGKLDFAILNAGLPSKGELADMTHEECQEIVNVNLLSYIWGSLESIRWMKGHAGHIVMTGSMSADVFDTRASVYVATKSAVRGFASSLRKEANPDGIKVSVIEPGTVSSAMVDETQAEQEKMIQEKRMLDPDSVAHAILFMLLQKEGCDIIEMKIRPHLQLI